MKIVCDACQAKYSISDDKVQGKVFKIRCKKCSNIIVVRGGANVAEAAPPPQQDKETHVYDYGHDGNQPQGDDAVWHVVINQDQVGPMTAGEVGQRFAAGEIDAESYIWREGFADWLPLAQVEQFQSLAAGASPGGGREAVSAMFGGGNITGEEAGTNRSDPGDLFAAASASSHAGRGEDDGGGDLFGSQQAAAQRADAGNAKLRGERNENSVLFSLNNLAQLASDKPAPSAAMTSMPSGQATGAAGGEGSGLIDIRSMASAYLGSSGAAVGKSTASVGTIDDLPVFGGGGFSEPAVIVPTARAAANNKILYVMIGAVGLLAVAAVIMVVVLIKGGRGDKSQDTQVAAAGTTGSGDTTATNGGAGGGGSGAAEASGKPSDTTTTTPTTETAGTGSGGSATQVAMNDTRTPATTTTPPAHPTPAPHPTHTETPHPSHATTSTTGAAPPPAHHDDPKPTTTASNGGGDAGGCDEVSCLLGTASGPCCAKFNKKNGGGSTGASKTAPPPSGGGGDLPETLDRDMISSGVGAVAGSAHACGSKAPGVKGKVKVHVKVSPAGTISGVDVSETPDPALGNCVAGAMSRAHFARTQKGGSFSYPFMF